MYTRYYDGYTDRNYRPKATVEEEIVNLPVEKEAETESIPAEVSQAEVASLPFNLPFNMQTDELILLAVLFLVATESKDDFILPLILGYLLISNT